MSAMPSSRGPKPQGQRRGTASAGRCGRSQQTGMEQLESLLDKPQLVVVEQPKERGMRFRYECEGRSAGSILGASSTDVNKTLPAIELQGPVEGIKNVTVTVSLVTKDIPHRPHPHCLVGKDCADGICIICINPQTTRCHSFVNLGIQCVRRKELDVSLMKRKNKNIDPFNTGQSKSIEDIDMNVVRLCFQCELEREDGDRIHLSPVVSNPIYDKKATTTAELKINRLNVVRGPCTGKTEIYMLCDKVQKDDIEIVFSLDDWEAKAEFAQTDVHRQIAIVFKSPPYQEQDISEEVEVNVSLRRISDRMYSDPVKFTYLPCNTDPYEVNRKRKIKSDIKFNEDCRVLPATDMMVNKPAPSHQFDPFCFATLDCGIPSATPAQEESQPLMAQILEDNPYVEDDLKQEDGCVSLDLDTMSNIFFSISECLGHQNVLQLLNNQDPNSNFMFDGTDPNFSSTSQPPMNMTSYYDAHFNQMVSAGQSHGIDHDSLPQDLLGISLNQVKTENEEDS
ncbi:transcription factor RelB isoform X2 [Colossoma macropomum]|uniref:transcription factor RelB isoform X2 n=2 Tax=Colossoma macropomum TaxID=42526 RepID=UPI001863C6C1|nr:transcription factor RelB isoform X2 [Colossoma macropomum]XP_036415624.1 transcription factor RelB isoform X2 [Colossoma macropomum]